MKKQSGHAVLGSEDEKHKITRAKYWITINFSFVLELLIRVSRSRNVNEMSAPRRESIIKPNVLEIIPERFLFLWTGEFMSKRDLDQR